MVARISSDGPYYGRRIDDIGSNRSHRGLPAFEVVWCSTAKSDYDQADGFMGCLVRRPPSRGVVISAALLQCMSRFVPRLLI